MKVTCQYGESASMGLNENLSNLHVIAEKREWKQWWMAPVPPPQMRGGSRYRLDVKAALCIISKGPHGAPSLGGKAEGGTPLLLGAHPPI